jgi:hypothetical protein
VLPKFRSFVRSIIHRSFIVPIHCSSFVHRHYSPFIVRSYELFTVTIHRYYSSIIRSPQISTTHPSCCPVHLRPARPTNSGDCDFHSSRELPIWSPIVDFSKLSTLNFGILSSQTFKKKGKPCLYGYIFNPIKPGPRYHSPLGPEYHNIPAIWVPPHCCLM